MQRRSSWAGEGQRCQLDGIASMYALCDGTHSASRVKTRGSVVAAPSTMGVYGNAGNAEVFPFILAFLLGCVAFGFEGDVVVAAAAGCDFGCCLDLDEVPAAAAAGDEAAIAAAVFRDRPGDEADAPE